MNTQHQVSVGKVQFASRDGLLITGDMYSADSPKGYLLLCHRSHYNPGEYSEIAPKLVAWASVDGNEMYWESLKRFLLAHSG